MRLETIVRHASDVIRWIDGSSRPGHPNPPPVPVQLEVELSVAPTDLRLFAKPGQTVLYRTVPAGLQFHHDQAGEVPDRPLQPGYTVAGTVSDPNGGYHPRTFSVTAGSATGQSVALFRALAQTRIPKAGALFGNVRFSDAEAAAWAVVEFTAQRTGGPASPVVFRAQADSHGDFLLPLTWLPQNPAEIVSSPKPKLTIRAQQGLAKDAVVNPDTLPTVNIRSSASAAMGSEFDVTLDVGKAKRLTSHLRKYLQVEMPA